MSVYGFDQKSIWIRSLIAVLCAQETTANWICIVERERWSKNWLSSQYIAKCLYGERGRSTSLDISEQKRNKAAR